ncbi:hypothetical protein RBI14_15640 [Alcaligenaceae bacterium B3P038]|nr:hypothetical protein [Alcaligenaceae bacterium B3P038]
MSLLSKTKLDRLRFRYSAALAAIKATSMSLAIAMAGGIAGYSVSRIEATHLLAEQSARHSKEILAVRDTYGAKAADTRDSVKAAAEGASDAAKAATKIVEQIGGPAVAARKQATKAQQASDRAQNALEKIQEIFPEGYVPPAPSLVSPNGDVPDWLNTP